MQRFVYLCYFHLDWLIVFYFIFNVILFSLLHFSPICSAACDWPVQKLDDAVSCVVSHFNIIKDLDTHLKLSLELSLDGSS